MSRQLKSNFSIATLSAMVSLILGVQVAEAATVGTTNIISSQNEPLSASIDISNIDADNFSANVAGSAVYEQMDMSTDVPVKVQFVKTSPSTGKLILTSAQAVKDPYADVVLVLNEAGKQQSLPKTLLLPVNDSPAPSNPPVPSNPPAPSNPIVTPRAATTAAVAPVNVIEPTQGAKPFVMVGDSINPNLPTVQPRTSYQLPTQAARAQNNNAPALPETSKPTASADNAIQSSSKVTVTRTIRPVGQSNNAVTSGNRQKSNTNSTNNNIYSQRPTISAPANNSPTNNSAPAVNTSPVATARSDNNRTGKPSIAQQRNTTTSSNTANNTASNTRSSNSAPLVLGDTDIQSDILTTEISRKVITPSGNLKVVPIPTTDTSANQNAQTSINNSTGNNSNTTSPVNTAANQTNFKPLIPAPAFKPSPTGEDNMIEAAIVRDARQTPNTSVVNVNTPDTVPKPSRSSEALQAESKTPSNTGSTSSARSSANVKNANANVPNIGVSKVTYTVQRNDNLWTIASQIARRNRVDVETVMNQIQAHNPDAFIDGDARLLKANANLSLPDYEVIPSRLGIRAATNAKQQASNQPATRPRQQASNRPRRNSAPSRPRPLPRANVTLVTPGGSGSATGGGNGGLSSALTNRVQATRQQTANEARRVAGLNSQLTEYTRKLQLQNARLGDLERRLKELRQE